MGQHRGMGESIQAFQRVLVPVEFVIADRKTSDGGEVVEAGGQTLEVAAAMRRSLQLGATLARGGQLRLVHATPSLAYAGIYGGPEGAWMPTETLRELDDNARRSSIKILEDLARLYCPGVEAQCRAPAGAATDVILEEAEDLHADLIVLATSGRGRARRFFLGSTADKVIRQAACPVLVVPSEVDES
jgi:nucleotide-binding universal stress UspA family protein